MASNRILIYLLAVMTLIVSCDDKVILSDEKTIGNIVLTATVESMDETNGIDITYKISTKDSIYVLEYGIKDQQRYLDRIYYFSYQVENDFWLEYDGVQQRCVGAIFERNYKLTNDIILHLHFDYPEKMSETGQFLLTYYAKEFNFPPVKMLFHPKK
ncbi:MAG TPA: hypothetical protein VLZ75_07400 [Chitinophagales bacterium]|nr:hypothetical protein [Chitinophagales bacterium]